MPFFKKRPPRGSVRVKGLSRLSHQGDLRSLRGWEDLNLSAILMYIVSMISSI